MSHSSGSTSSSSASAKNSDSLYSWETISTDSNDSNGPSLSDTLLSHAQSKIQLKNESKAESDDIFPAHLRAFAENIMHKLKQLPPNKYHAACKKIDDLLYEELMSEDCTDAADPMTTD
jgi:hypothetical protein